MSKFDEKMSEMLDIPTSTSNVVESVPTVVQNKTDNNIDVISKDLMDDYEQSRKQLKEIVSKGAGAIDDILAIARESEHPRAFEVAATMIKTVADANEKLLGMQKQMKEITGQKNNGQLNVGKAAIFVGSTAELSKMIKNEMKIIDGDS
jgi:tetrahydromethanopterin S-methyltransferase subunit A